MFEPKSKKRTNWILVINEERISFRTKKLAIIWGKNAIKCINDKVELYEEYYLYDTSLKKTVFICKESFDRTELLKE